MSLLRQWRVSAMVIAKDSIKERRFLESEHNLDFHCFRSNPTVKNTVLSMKIICSDEEIAYINSNNMNREVVAILIPQPGPILQMLFSHLSRGSTGTVVEGVKEKGELVTIRPDSFSGNVMQYLYNWAYLKGAQKNLHLDQLIDGLSMRMTHDDSKDIENEIIDFVENFHIRFSMGLIGP